MSDQSQRFEWNDAEPGLQSDEFLVKVTDSSIQDYRLATGDQSRRTPVAYIFVAAPQRRHATMASVGCHAPEQDKYEPRSTPYVGSTVRYHREISTGDIVRSRTFLDRKFERGGNRFIVFRVDATNSDGEAIAEYEYTCLWERGEVRSSLRRSSVPKDLTTTIGEVLTKNETSETIAAYGKLPVGRPGDWLSTHTNEEFASKAIFRAPVNAGVATVGYTTQWLDSVERSGFLWNGGCLESRALAPVKAGDSLQISGMVLEENLNEARVYEILVVNQSGVTVFRSVATFSDI